MGEFLDKEGLTRFKEKMLTEVEEIVGASGGGTVTSVDGKTGAVDLSGTYQPKGNYLTSAPVTSVNGLTGAVTISVPPTPNSYVTETWSNGGSWYRKYSDGFIEQGGVIAQTSNGYKENQSLTFPTAFSNTNYSIVFSGSVGSASTISYGTNNVGSRTTTGVTYCVHGNPVASASWYACGY